MAYTQALRPFAVATPLGPDVLLLAGLSGVEEISRPFDFVLNLLSEQRGVDVDALVGLPACVRIVTPDGDTRFIHGLVRRVREIGSGAVLTSYQAELVPWLWMLSLSADCRIFQQLSVPEIVSQVFTSLGHSDYELRLVRTYPKREYCVQYRETHLDFVSRLLEDEGIAYHFVHTADKHVLVLTDGPAGMRACPGPAVLAPDRTGATRTAWAGDTYTALTVDRTLQTRAVALTDYDYLHPSVALATTTRGDEGLGETFDYPGGYAELGEGDRYARLRLEVADAQRETAEGVSGAATLTPGHRTTFAGDGPGAGGRRWLVTRVAHEARENSYVAQQKGEEQFTYTNRFLLASSDIPWRPTRSTARPRVAGTQSALVVGRSGEEIWTDAHGRVKLHFYWDRHGTRDEHSSCWVRCSSAWAGRGYGQFSVPRIGQEVLVDFLEGDPDRPIVVGRVFNADQPPPCDPGGSRGVVSGMRSKTHKGAGYNGIEMNDTAGKEHMAVHAQYDLATDVGHDETHTVGNNRTSSVAVNETCSVASNQSLTVGAQQTVSVGATRKTTIGADDVIQVAANATMKVGANRDVTVSGTESLKVGGTRTVTVAGSQSETVGGSQHVSTAAGHTIAVGGALAMTAASITLTVGGSSITVAASGITISAPAVTVTGSGTVTVTGGMVKVNS